LGLGSGTGLDTKPFENLEHSARRVILALQLARAAGPRHLVLGFAAVGVNRPVLPK
jgi:hypothetical protein